MTEEEEDRVARAMNAYIGGLVQRGMSPTPEEIDMFARSERNVIRSGRKAPLPEPEKKTGNFFQCFSCL